MGLRERHAAQTRELILDAAMSLFLEHGYDTTTMEEIAEAADIGASTLYRYFPTKDQLVLDPIALRGQMAAEVRARPDEEPLEDALGHALVAILTTPRPGTGRLRHLLALVDSSSALQARLSEDFVRERALLEHAIAERLGRGAEDLVCQLTARSTMTILELVGSHPHDDVPEDNAAAVRGALDLLRGILDQLRAEPLAIPRID